jgi:hypothetical protein
VHHEEISNFAEAGKKKVLDTINKLEEAEHKFNFGD